MRREWYALWGALGQREMKNKQIQLANIYKRGRFYGYGIAVDGELLSNQLNTNIETQGIRGPPIIKAEFCLTTEMIKNPIDIELPNIGEGEGNS